MIMVTKRDSKKKIKHLYSFIPALQPLSKEEKEELKMRIIVAINQSVALS